MARRCTICDRDDVHQIDADLIAGVPYREIASRINSSTSTLQRHRRNHLTAKLVEAKERDAEADVTNIVDVRTQLETVNTEALRILRAAKRDKDHRLALGAIDRLTKLVELQARLADMLNDAPQVAVSVAVNDSWASTRLIVMQALEGHTEARSSVLKALEEAGR